LHAQFDLGLNKGLNYIEIKQLVESIYKGKYLDAVSKEAFPSLAIQPRYYFHHKKQQVKAATGFQDFMLACILKIVFTAEAILLIQVTAPVNHLTITFICLKQTHFLAFSSAFSDMVI
jgi:hypothetical protein